MYPNLYLGGINSKSKTRKLKSKSVESELEEGEIRESPKHQKTNKISSAALNQMEEGEIYESPKQMDKMVEDKMKIVSTNLFGVPKPMGTATINKLEEGEIYESPKSKTKSKSISKSKSKTKSPLKQSLNVVPKARKTMKKHSSFEKKIEDVDERLAKYLRKMCPDAGDCLGFGRELDRLYKLFDGYSFDHVVFPIRLLANGANGFVNHLAYVKNGYVSYAILKNAKKPESDNLMYEAFVGLNYINKQTRYFPCFLETYAALKHIDYSVYMDMRDQYGVDGITDLSQQFKNVTKKLVIPPDYYGNMETRFACEMPVLNALLIEFIPRPISLFKYMSAWAKSDWMTHFELPVILFQIYAVLNSIKHEFTHYDLHYENVMLYEIPNGKHIIMKYHDESGDVISFPSRFIAKILDYGRSYCPQVDTYYKSICQHCNKPTGRPCGYNEGHKWFMTGNEQSYYIGVLDTNISHDLRLGAMVRELLIQRKAFKLPISGLLKQIKYGSKYGTREDSCPTEDRICDVEDMYESLNAYVNNSVFESYYETEFDPQHLEGTMNIYLDRSKELSFVGHTK